MVIFISFSQGYTIYECGERRRPNGRAARNDCVIAHDVSAMTSSSDDSNLPFRRKHERDG